MPFAEAAGARGTRTAGPVAILGVGIVLAVLLDLALVTAAGPLRVGPAASTGGAPLSGTGARVGTGSVRLADGSTVVCAARADCGVWAAALAGAEAALDPVLPAEPPVSDLTVVAPTAAGQTAVLGVPGTSRPAATTLVVDEAMVASGRAPSAQRGRTWIVVNPDIARAGGDLPRQVLTHELVHARTRAAVLGGPLWVEEGYAVALTHRVLGPSAGPVAPASATTVGWPPDDWVPRTLDDYGTAGQVVTDLAARIGWAGVARWYAASEAGAGSLAAARTELDRRDVMDERG